MQASNPKVHVWISGGEEYMLTTPQKPNESQESWCARHDSAIAYWEGVYPPD